MKKFTLSALALLLMAATVVPAAQAQVSTRQELGEDTSFIEFVRFNRDARSHK